MTQTIEESLVCSEIMSYIGASQLEKIQTTSRAFYEIAQQIIGKCDVLPYSGVYKYNGHFWLPFIDVKYDSTIHEEHDRLYLHKLNKTSYDIARFASDDRIIVDNIIMRKYYHNQFNIDFRIYSGYGGPEDDRYVISYDKNKIISDPYNTGNVRSLLNYYDYRYAMQHEAHIKKLTFKKMIMILCNQENVSVDGYVVTYFADKYQHRYTIENGCDHTIDEFVAVKHKVAVRSGYLIMSVRIFDEYVEFHMNQ